LERHFLIAERDEHVLLEWRPASLRVSRPRRSTLRLQGGADGREEVSLARMADKAVRRAFIEA
jgi:hypothetical protein